ncbi:MAG: hypothetical protein ABI634_18710 [Acidobacteriota bacterium]
MVIRKINPWSCAKVAGVLYALMGLIFGGLFSLVGLGLGSLASREQFPMAGMIFGAGAIVALPIFYGLLGAVTSAIAALLYNVVAGMIGGIEIEVTTVDPVPR